MKKILLVTVLLLIGFQSIAQKNTTSEEKKEPKDNTIANNEIKLNVVYLIAGIPEIGYEYLINEESGVGVNLLFSIDNDIDFKFALTPYYRFYFGKKKAAGFFAEGFGMLNIIDTYNDYYYYDDPNYPFYSNNGKSETDVALGIAVGGKFITNRGFVFEIYGGMGRNLFNSNSEDFVPRFGITFGKRF